MSGSRRAARWRTSEEEGRTARAGGKKFGDRTAAVVVQHVLRDRRIDQKGMFGRRRAAEYLTQDRVKNAQARELGLLRFTRLADAGGHGVWNVV